MDILLYVTELLQSRKTVGIVGLGTLYKKKSPGKYDSEKHAFIPPSYTLAFTTEVKEQEELISFISEKRKIGIDSATYYVKEYAEKIQAQLADQQEANLEPIGKLQLIDHEIILIADLQSNFDFEFYGLPTLNELPTENITNTEVSNEDIKVTSEEFSTTEATIAEVVAENKSAENNPDQEITENLLTTTNSKSEDQLIDRETSETKSAPLPNDFLADEFQVAEKPVGFVPNSFTPNYDYDEDKPNRTGKILVRILIVLFIIAIGSAVVYFFFPDLLNKRIEDSPAHQTVPMVPLAPTVHTSSSLDSINLADSITRHTKPVGLVKEVKPKDTIETIVYEVIGSAEKNQKRIDYVINYMKKRGITAKPLPNPSSKMIKISLGSFTDYNLAKEYQDSLRIKLKNPQIYIQSIKSTH